MTAENTSIVLSKPLFSRLEKVSAQSRLTPQAIVKQAIADRLEYEEWALAQIDAGLEDLKAGRVYSREEAYKKLDMIGHGHKKI